MSTIACGPIEAEMRARYAAARRALNNGRRVPLPPAPEPEPDPPPPAAPEPDMSLVGNIEFHFEHLPPPYQFEPVAIDTRSDPNHPLHWRLIIEQVAAKYRIPVSDLTSARRQRTAVRARHEAMWRMRIETSMGYPAIGRRLGGRDHTTVIHGVAKHQQRIDAGEVV